MKYINNSNLPLSMQVFLAHNSYDGTNEGKSISATSLLKSTRQIILGGRIEDDVPIELISLVPSRIGTAFHEAVEAAWKSDGLMDTLKSLNVPKGLRERLRVNPVEVTEDIIPVYLEQRTSKQFKGWGINGQFDIIVNGVLEDIKSTSVYSYMSQTNVKKYQLQGSIYRWLNPELITEDYMLIDYIFTDWNKHRALSGNGYPTERIMSQKIPLLSLEETERFIEGKLRELDSNLSKDEWELPKCTAEELWRTDTKYKYLSKPDAKRGKNFDSAAEAQAYLHEKGKGTVIEVLGEVKACKYCAAFALCSQKDQYLLSKELKI